MKTTTRILVLCGTHIAALGVGFALGLYALPILTAPPGPTIEAVRSTAQLARFRGEFRRDLAGSDAFHWGEGRVFITHDRIAFEGRLAPGPDYRLYLSPRLVETEADFETLRSRMVEVGDVRTFENFEIPESIDPAAFGAVIIWCESFGEFITATGYE